MKVNHVMTLDGQLIFNIMKNIIMENIIMENIMENITMVNSEQLFIEN